MDSPGQRAPTELEIARVRLLYRFASVPARGRMLELGASGESVFRGQAWTGEFAESRLVADPAGDTPLADDYFDLVILHGTLDQLWTAAAAHEREHVVGHVLGRVARALAPGGVVAGCVQNRHCLKRLLRRPSRADSPLSVMACRRALQRAGFRDTRLFSILPGLESPSRLVSIEKGWSPRACRRQVEAMRPLIGPSSYAAWRGLAALGVSQYLGAATFFWGRKPC